jgi:hypothetical protein
MLQEAGVEFQVCTIAGDPKIQFNGDGGSAT